MEVIRPAPHFALPSDDSLLVCHRPGSGPGSLPLCRHQLPREPLASPPIQPIENMNLNVHLELRQRPTDLSQLNN